MFTYCPKCKNELQRDNHRYDCASCDFIFFINPSPTNGAFILNKHNEVLLAKRAVEPSKDLWDTPGGFIDWDENAEDSLTREIQEELGITITDWVYIKSYPGTYDWGGMVRPILALMYYAHTDHTIADMTPQDDISGAQFFAFNDLPVDSFAFPPMHTMFVDLQNLLKNTKQ